MKNLLIAVAVLMLLSGCAVAKASAGDLNRTSWTLVRLNGADLIPESVVTLHFEDGAVSGNAGCNTYGSSYTVEDEQITLGEAFSTMMYCMDPEGLMDQEIAYLTALRTAATFQIEGDTLTLWDADGNAIGEFRASKD